MFQRLLLKSKRKLLMAITAVCASTAFAEVAVSPNGKLSVEQKEKGLVVNYQGRQVIELPSVGFESAASPAQLVFSRSISEDYTMVSGKRLRCTNEAREYLMELGKGVRMELRLYNDGIAFRYEFTGAEEKPLPRELTTWRIPEGMKRWMQQWTDSYESFFPLTTSYQTKPIPSFSGISKSEEGWNNRWGYPALLEPADGVFVLLTEANIERRQSASCLMNDKENYRVVPADNQVTASAGWHNPWRLAIVGELKDVVESTLVTDVSEPCKLEDISWIRPGVVSWIYWAYNHGSNDYQIIRKYVDMAAELKLPYVLIDAEWDTMKDGYTIEDAVNYAKSKGIRPLIWYNSSVGWVDGAPTPKYRLNKAEDREKEFAWCESLGVAGVKIDFFSGDNQMNMEYCIDLMESAARHHLLVNFHGATIPRGWQRTYPNLLSTEGVYGAEWYNNVPTFTDKAACHNATLPFTRNVVGPMDYTPCAFSDSQHPHITSHAHELALTVLFESGLQHLADRPESFLAQPKEVQQFLGQLPSVWDETRLVAGYPGDYALIARRSGTTWYVAGINGTDNEKAIDINLKPVVGGGEYQLTSFADSGDTASPWIIRTENTSRLPQHIECKPRGGFVFVMKSEK